MDDQQGHVIDGTARARQWRRSKPKPGVAPDTPETRSDAPKSFAGSLLVPADMLPAAFAADERLNENEQDRAPASPPVADADRGARASAEHGLHENPFLVPEAARVEHRSTSKRRRMLAALLAGLRGLLSARGSSRAPLRRVAMPRWRGELRLTELLALAALTAAVVIAAVIATHPNAAHPSSASVLGATGSLFERGSGIAVGNPFAPHAPARDRVSRRPGRAPAHRTVITHRRPRPASTAVVVMARYTPPASDARIYAASSATSSNAGSTPTAAPARPASTSPGATARSSSSGTSRPAFGENGTLGPGRGAPGTQ